MGMSQPGNQFPPQPMGGPGRPPPPRPAALGPGAANYMNPNAPQPQLPLTEAPRDPNGRFTDAEIRDAFMSFDLDK